MSNYMSLSVYGIDDDWNRTQFVPFFKYTKIFSNAKKTHNRRAAYSATCYSVKERRKIKYTYTRFGMHSGYTIRLLSTEQTNDYNNRF